MEASPAKKIWTIGHSTRSWEEFLELLQEFSITGLVDVRSYPGSRKFPHFHKENMEELLPKNGISYTHLKSLGGRRKPDPNSGNTVWRHPSFRSYADYMQTEEFHKGIRDLEKMGQQEKIAYMCSEAVWWRCHRSMISDELKVREWEVLHIMGQNKTTEHPFTAPAKVINGKLVYGNSE